MPRHVGREHRQLDFQVAISHDISRIIALVHYKAHFWLHKELRESLRAFVLFILVFLELSIFVDLAQVSLRSLSGFSQFTSNDRHSLKYCVSCWLGP